MQEIGRVVGKYLFPILLVALGIALLIISPNQTKFFLFGGLGILLVGILGFLYVKGVISGVFQIILVVIVVAGAAFFSFKDVDVIQDRLDYTERKQMVETHIKQRMKDIRKAQVAYKKENGTYTASFDTLTSFVKNGRLSIIKRFGSLPDSVPTEEMARELGIIQKMPADMTEAEVMRQGIIVRDTVMEPVMGYIFDKDDRKNRKTKLSIDSLAYVPFGKHKFEMETGTVESGGVRQSAFIVRDPKPFDEQLILGSLTEASTSGNWKE